MSTKGTRSRAVEAVERVVGAERLVVVSPDYFEVLGTDRVRDANAELGPDFAAYRRAWRENPEGRIVGEFPLHLDIEVTNKCNLRCTMCQVPFDSMVQGFMETELYERILAEVRSHKLPSVKFNFRGEPLMNRDIATFVRLAKEAGILEVQFNSNGTLLTEALSRELIEGGLDRIKFSVDAVTAELYEALRTGAKYERTVSKILRMIELRDSMGRALPSIQVQMVYMESNHDEVVRYIRFWEDKVNRMGFSRYRAGENVTGEKQRVERKGERFPCHQLYQRLVVLFDGTVLMCCGDHKALHPLGNVRYTPLADIWRGEALARVRNLHAQARYDAIEACRHCEVNYL